MTDIDDMSLDSIKNVVKRKYGVTLVEGEEKEILVPEEILTPLKSIRFNDGKQLLTQQEGMYKVLTSGGGFSKYTGWKLVKCDYKDLMVGDVAFKWGDETPDPTYKEAYRIILKDGAYAIVENGTDTTYYSEVDQDANWWKVVPR